MKVEKIKNPDIQLWQGMLMDSCWGMTGWTKAEREKCWKEMIMKIERIKKAFEPITITLENKKELHCLEAALSLARNVDCPYYALDEFCDDLSNKLALLWLPEAMENIKDETIKGDGYKNDSEEN